MTMMKSDYVISKIVEVIMINENLV